MNTTLGTAYMVGKKKKKRGAFSSQGTSLALPPDLLLILEDSKHTSVGL